MSQIKRIETLVHPDFLLMQEMKKTDRLIHHPNELALRRRWDEMAVSVYKNPSSRLVYMTWLSQREIEKATAEGGLDHPWKNLDFERIEEYQMMIGNRLTIAPLYPRYTPKIIDQVLQGQTLSPAAELYMQGEWTNACVRREGNDLADLLGIDKDRRIIVADNSRMSWEGKVLLEWHQAQNQGV